jgi:linoleoyl-CoA desaturase
MNTLKFEYKNEIEQQFIRHINSNVDAYFEQKNISTKANSKMIIKTVILIGLYIIPFIFILIITVPPIISLLFVIIMGLGIAGIGMNVMHDACHGAYSKKKWVNNLLSGTLYLLGSNVLNWKIQHNVLHHTYTNILGLDEDIDDKGPIRLSENKPLKHHHKFQFIYAFFFYGLMTLSMLANDFTRLISYNKKGLVKGQNKKLIVELLKMLGRKIIYVFVIIGLPLWLTDYSIGQILFGFILMHWIASIILSVIFQMAHIVDGAAQPSKEIAQTTDWSVHQLNTTSDFARNNRFLTWYVGGLNFQIEHHLFPTICHIHYKNIAPIVELTAKECNLNYNLKSNFRSAILSHIHRLKELGQK